MLLVSNSPAKSTRRSAAVNQFRRKPNPAATMKIACIVLIALGVALAAPVDETGVKEKRGLHFGLGYHAPLVTSHVVAAPAIVHHAPLITHHAPIITHHAPLITHHAPLLTHHAPLLTHSSYSSYHLPSYHSYHHY